MLFRSNDTATTEIYTAVNTLSLHDALPISSKHTLALTNRGGATGDEVAELARYVQQRVQSEFGVLLHPEPVLLGLSL